MLAMKSFAWLVLVSLQLQCYSFRFVTQPGKHFLANTAASVSVAGNFEVDQFTVDQFTSQRDRVAADLLNAAQEIGTVGKLASEDARRRMDELAQQLKPFSDPHPAEGPLTGTHSLVYSGSEKGPTSGLVGPFVGSVTQVFWNETVYQNRVRFGPLQVSIFGERKLVDDETINVRFYRAQVHLWDKLVVQREVDLGHSGQWEFIFVGKVMFQGKEVLLRVMNTPQLFVLTQPVAET